MSARDVIVSTGCALATCFALYASHLYLTRDDVDYDEWRKREMKKRGIDRLNIHKSLFFGIQTRSCDIHETGTLRCDDLECKYGPMSYIANLIDDAKETLDMAIYIMTAEIIGQAVIAAHQRGVVVRIICDTEMSFSPQSSVREFKSLGMQVRRKMSPYIMHHKFMIVDKEIVASGSMNFTMTALLGNWENVVVSSSPDLVDLFVEGFEKLWEEFGNYSRTEDDV